MDIMRVLICDKLADEGVRILEDVKGFQVDCRFGLTSEEVKSIIRDYHGLIIRSTTNVTAEILERADHLQVIGRAGVGLDNIDLESATKKGITVLNTPAANTTATAEHTIGMILALSRHIPQADASMKAGKWERSKFKGAELNGKKLGIIGFGRIGATVAMLAKVFGMVILVYDPYLKTDTKEQKDVTTTSLEDLLKESDYITIHIPQNAETENLISDGEFNLMKRTTRVINCARGGIVNEAALVKALRQERIAGCALDVYEAEPLSPDSPLRQLDKCVLTPHLGAATDEARVNVAVTIAQAVRDELLKNAS